MSAWPADGSPARLEDLSEPFHALFLRLYPGFDPNKAVPISEWAGPPLDGLDRASMCEPPHYLDERGLRHGAESGVDALRSFIECVIRVGMGQGRRRMLDRPTRMILQIAAARLYKDGSDGAALGRVLVDLATYGVASERNERNV